MITTVVLGIGDLRWADWRDEISYNGDIWEPHPFVVNRINAGKVNQTGASVVCEDSNKELAELSASGGLTGAVCLLYYIKYENGEWVEDTEFAQFELPISDCSGQFPDVVLELSAYKGWRRSGGIPSGDKTCKHVFKGLRCQYAGVDTSCPRDREHCRLVKVNLVNYGGFHFALDAGATVNIGPEKMTIPASGTGGRIQPGYLGGDSGVEEDPTPWNPRQTSPPGPYGPQPGGYRRAG